MKIDLRGFVPGTYMVSCNHDGWGDFGPSTFSSFPVTVGASGSASSSGPCFLDLASLTGNGAYVTVVQNGTEIARSGWLGGTPSDGVEPAYELEKVTDVKFLTSVFLWGIRLPSVNWSAVAGASSYEVEWSKVDGERGSSSVDVAVACCTHGAGGLALIANQVRVRAVNDSGKGPWSDVASAAVRPAKVTGIEYRSGFAEWDAVQGAASYDIQWKYGGETPKFVEGLNELRYRIARIEGKLIRVAVRAVNQSDQGPVPGPWSAWVTVIAPFDKPSEVSGLEYSSGLISWRPASNATHYEVSLTYAPSVFGTEADLTEEVTVPCVGKQVCSLRPESRRWFERLSRGSLEKFTIRARGRGGVGPEATYTLSRASRDYSLTPGHFSWRTHAVDESGDGYRTRVQLPETLGEWSKGSGGRSGSDGFLYAFSRFGNSDADRAAAWFLTPEEVPQGYYKITVFVPKACSGFVIKFSCADPDPDAEVVYNVFNFRDGDTRWTHVGSVSVNQNNSEHNTVLYPDDRQYDSGMLLPGGTWLLEGHVAVVVEDRQADHGRMAVDTAALELVQFSQRSKREIAEQLAIEALVEVYKCAIQSGFIRTLTDDQIRNVVNSIDWDNVSDRDWIDHLQRVAIGICNAKKTACEQGVGQAMGLTTPVVANALRLSAVATDIQRFNRLARAYEAASDTQINPVEIVATELVQRSVCG